MREIAKLTGHSRNTIRRVIREKVPRAFCTPSRPSKLDPFKDYLRERFLDHGLSAVRLFAEVRAMGFTGSEIIVRRFVHTLRESSCKKLTVRFETPPGDNFLNARSFTGLDDLNAQGRAWLVTTANVRIHSTTGERPWDLLAKEELTPIGAITPYQVVHCVYRGRKCVERGTGAQAPTHTRVGEGGMHTGQLAGGRPAAAFRRGIPKRGDAP